MDDHIGDTFTFNFTGSEQISESGSSWKLHQFHRYKKSATIIPLILSAIFIILLYNNLSNEGSASYRVADITSSNDRSHANKHSTIQNRPIK